MSIDEIGDGYITVTVNLDNIYQTQKMKLPCLITIEKDACTPRLPSFKRKLETGKDVITVYSAQDLKNVDSARCGLKGSPTQVERIFPPKASGEHKLYEQEAEAQSETLYGILADAKFV